MALSLKRNAEKKAEGQGLKRSFGRKGFSAARGSRFALLVGDDGAILTHIRDKSVLSRHFVADQSASNLQEFSDVLQTDPTAPIYFIVDSMDQAFVQQSLPPVSSLSVNKLINRRLERDFGVNDIKGALLIGREKTGRKDWNFLMVSVERTRSIGGWLDFIGTMPNPFGGVLLLSVEVERIFQHFDNTTDLVKEGAPAQWKFFVSHNKVGGFRQVIIRNGRIIFTRMTQPVGEATPEVIAGNIEQETSSTLEYMKRLGFVPQAGLEMLIITSNAVRTVLDLSRFGARSVNIITPFEASQALGITGATQQGDQYGDVVLASCIAADKKHVLPLSVKQFSNINLMHDVLKYQRVLAGVSFLGLIGYGGMVGYDFYLSYSKSSELITQRNQEQNTLDTIKAEIKRSNMDVNKISDVIDIYKEMRPQRVSPVPMIARIEAITRQPVALKSIEWSLDSGPAKGGAPISPISPAMLAGAGSVAVPAAAPVAAAKPSASGLKMTAIFTIEFKDPGKRTDVLRAQSEKVLDFFKEAFPAHSVDYVKPVIAPTKENESVNITFEPKKDDKKAEVIIESNKPVEAQIAVKGDVIDYEPKPVATPAPAPAATAAPAASPAAVLPAPVLKQEAQ